MSFTSEPAVKTLENYFTIIVGTLHIRDVRNTSRITQFSVLNLIPMYLKYKFLY